MKKEIYTTGELTLSRQVTYGKKEKKKTVPVFTSRMEKREYYQNVQLFDIRNVLDVKGLLKDISVNLHTYVKQVHQWIQSNPIKKLIVTGIFTVLLGVSSITANAAYIHEYTYQVKNGEKIEEIAVKHGVSVQGILDANGLTSIEGKKILLPKVQDKTVTATILNIRSQPTTNSSIIGKYKKGDVVKAAFVENGWAGILINGRVCFVSADYITEKVNSSTIESQAKTMYVTATSLRVREAATTSSTVLGSLKLNDSVLVTASINGWAKINFNGKKAFVSETYLTSKEQIKTSLSSSSTVYVIKAGDTFSKIARAQGITVDSIQKLNPAVVPTKLKIGQKINIPVVSNPNQIKVEAEIGYVDPQGIFRFITADGRASTAKAAGPLLSELLKLQGKKVTLTLEGKRGQELNLISLQ